MFCSYGASYWAEAKRHIGSKMHGAVKRRLCYLEAVLVADKENELLMSMNNSGRFLNQVRVGEVQALRKLYDVPVWKLLDDQFSENLTVWIQITKISATFKKDRTIRHGSS